MGTWEGHISPGVAFYTFGVFYSFMYTRQFIMKSYLKQNNYQNNSKQMRGETVYERFVEQLVTTFISLSQTHVLNFYFEKLN